MSKLNDNHIWGTLSSVYIVKGQKEYQQKYKCCYTTDYRGGGEQELLLSKLYMAMPVRPQKFD